MIGVEQEALAVLRGRPEGLPLIELRDRLAERGLRVDHGPLEVLLLLSPRLVERDGRWHRGQLSRAETLIDALDRYAADSGRSLFRAESALQTLPVEQRPSQEELVQTLLQSDRFELLRNNMIRVRGR